MRSLSSALSALGLLPLARPIQQSSHASAPPPSAAVLPSGSEGRSTQGAWGARGVRWAAIITAIILVSSLVAVPPLVDGETGRPIMDAGLVFPISYLVLSPVGDVMDALTLLSVSQTIALVISLLLLYAVWRVVRWRRRGSTVLRELGAGLVALAGLVAFYAAGILVPRPMAALATNDPDLVAVDVHSHTGFSHDARRDFDARANRAWHQAAGFDVAYITDHKSFEGAAEGMRLNPRLAGDGLVILSGIEFVTDHNHLNALGIAERDTAWVRVASGSLEAARATSSLAPVLVQTIPEGLEKIPRADAAGRGGVLAIELSDGAPRGIEQRQRDRARILRIADSLDLAVVAGSNNHGWGRTAVAWSLLRIPGWRALTPASLGEAIEQRIRTERRHAVRVVERRSPDPGRSMVARAATLPLVAWNLLTTLSFPQRISWIIWSWALAALTFARRSHRATA